MKQKDQKRCVIVGGAPIIDYQNLIPYLREDDYLVFCDCGLKHLQRLQEAKGSALVPDLIVGDFDSMEEPKADCEVIKLPVEKDDTDVSYCIKEGLKRGFKSFEIYGALGGARLSHTLANIQLLSMIKDNGAEAVLSAGGTGIFLMRKGESVFIEKNDIRSVSLFSLSDESIVSTDGLKYPLKNGKLGRCFPLGVSNSFEKESAQITVHEGEIAVVTENI